MSNTYPKHFSGEMIEVLAMSECPNHCEHCCVNYKGHIDFDTLSSLFEICKERNMKMLISGTELLMDEKYLEFCNKIGQNFIYTNGALLNDKNYALMKKYGINRISLSYHYGIQDQLTHIDQDKIDSILSKAVSEGFYVRAFCTVTKDNINYMSKVAERAYGLGAKSIKFLNMLEEGRAAEKDFRILDRTDLKQFFKNVNDIRKKYDKKDFYVTRNGAFGYDTENRCNFRCTAGHETVVLAPNGNIYPCVGLMYDEYIIGYWTDKKIIIEKEFDRGEHICKVLERQL